MKMIKALVKIGMSVGLIIIVFMGILIIMVGPVDSSPDNCRQVSGVVQKIEEAGTKDVVFTLRENPYTYYINRGLERGLDLKDLQVDLLDKEIKLWHAGSWFMKGGHVAHLEHDGDVLYTEWEPGHFD